MDQVKITVSFVDVTDLDAKEEEIFGKKLLSNLLRVSFV